MMKKNKFILLGLFLFLFVFPAMAQISLSAFSGLNFEKLTGDAPTNGYYGNKTGLNAGIMVDISLSKTLKLSVQPSFSQEGTKILYQPKQFSTPVDSIQIRLNYVSLPLIIKVKSTSKHFYAIGGLETGWLLNYKLTSHGDVLANQLSVSNFNLTAHFGAGYRIFIGFPVLFIELRYSQGLINLTNEPITNSYIPRVKTTGFKALIGIELPLSKSIN